MPTTIARAMYSNVLSAHTTHTRGNGSGFHFDRKIQVLKESLRGLFSRRNNTPTHANRERRVTIVNPGQRRDVCCRQQSRAATTDTNAPPSYDMACLPEPPVTTGHQQLPVPHSGEALNQPPSYDETCPLGPPITTGHQQLPISHSGEALNQAPSSQSCEDTPPPPFYSALFLKDTQCDTGNPLPPPPDGASLCSDCGRYSVLLKWESQDVQLQFFIYYQGEWKLANTINENGVQEVINYKISRQGDQTVTCSYSIQLINTNKHKCITYTQLGGQYQITSIQYFR